jgi:hypothetical protein
MFTDVYAHFFQDGLIHVGAVLPGAPAYVRPEEVNGKRLQAYVRVSFKDSAPKAAASLHKVIEEAFSSLKAPEEGRPYTTETDLGTLEIMYRLGYPGTAEAAKEAMDAAMRLVALSPTVKFSDKGQGGKTRPPAL